MTVVPSASSISTAQAPTATVAVNGSVPTATGSVTLTSGSYTSAATTLSGGSVTINVPAGSLAVGGDTLTASYPGDSNYNAGTGNAPITVTTAVSPSFSIVRTGVNVARGATTNNNSTITVTPNGDSTRGVALSATISSSPTGAQYPPTLSFGTTSPVTIAGSAAGTATLTISTTAATNAALASPRRPDLPWYATGGAALACILLFGIPARRHNLRTMLGMLALLVALTGGMLACGGGSTGNGGGGGPGNTGTTVGSYTITLTGTSGSTTANGTVTLTVQ